jgi:hypothetical protein
MQGNNAGRIEEADMKINYSYGKENLSFEMSSSDAAIATPRSILIAASNHMVRESKTFVMPKYIGDASNMIHAGVAVEFTPEIAGLPEFKAWGFGKDSLVARESGF